MMTGLINEYSIVLFGILILGLIVLSTWGFGQTKWMIVFIVILISSLVALQSLAKTSNSEITTTTQFNEVIDSKQLTLLEVYSNF